MCQQLNARKVKLRLTVREYVLAECTVSVEKSINQMNSMMKIELRCVSMDIIRGCHC